MSFEDLYRAWKARRISQVEAATELGISERTFRRHVRRYEEAGPEGLIDKRLSQRSPRRAPRDEIDEVVNAYTTGHEGWNVKRFYAWYRSRGGQRSYNWVRLQLQDAGAVRKLPSRGLHRKRFERAARTGQRLHQDGYRHVWLNGRRCDLVVTMDDATGTHYCMLLCEREGTRSSLLSVRHVIEREGFFCALCTDRAVHYGTSGRPATRARTDNGRYTQFQRAMQELGIQLIPSRSTRERARCQRAFDIHTQRLPVRLAEAGITDMDEANRYLEDVYRHRYNEEFQQVPQLEESAFDPWPNPRQLHDILCERHGRIVRADNSVRFRSRLLKLPGDRMACKLARTRVEVRHHLDDTVSIHRGIRLIATYDNAGKLIL